MTDTNPESLFETLAKFVQQRDILAETELFDMIKERSFRQGNFTLASGRASDHFFDLKPVMLDPLGANLIAEAVLVKLELLSAMYPFHAIGGLAIGAVPIVSVVVSQSFHAGMPLPGFFVRKQVKDHGTERLIDGLDVAGKAVILIEDVTTTGGSLLQAAEAVRAAGGYVGHAITVVDREEGGYDSLNTEGIKLLSLYKLSEFLA